MAGKTQEQKLVTELELEDEQEEEHFTRVDVGCSWTLIGSLFFTMVMFYFVNYPDDDIKRYTWSTINTTLSIFTAVLAFNGLDQLMVNVVVAPVLGAFPVGSQELARVLVGFVAFLAWYGIALTAIALAAGLMKRDDAELKSRRTWVITDFMRGDHGTAVNGHQLIQNARSKGIADVRGVEVFVASRSLHQENYETRTKCWSTLFAHMTGFAMISAGGDLQNSPPFLTVPMSWLAVLLCILFLVGVFSLVGHLYRRDEGSEAKELFVDESAEAEDDVLCLSVSFLLVQSARFSITGVLPSKLGLYHDKELETAQTSALYGIGALSAVLMVLAALTMPHRRAKSLVVGTFSMGFAWCLLFATRSLFDASHFLMSHEISPWTIEGRILLAMCLSLFACFIIVVLDKIEDGLQKPADELHTMLKHVITSLSILIGFTWEHTFDGCVEAISSLFEDTLTIKLVLIFLIVVIVTPAWRKYILAKVVHLETAA